MSASNSEAARSARGRGRELALWVLCHLESHVGEERAAFDLFWDSPPAIDADDEFLVPYGGQLGGLLADSTARRWARRLAGAYLDHKEQVDAALEGASKRWRVVRMDRVDRNLLRLCAVELLREETPRNVVVSESVRLAARYGSERSVAFVNGVAEALAQVVRDSPESG